MPRTPGRPSQLAAAPSREDLLACAFQQFAEKPYETVSLRALARKMDVSDTLYNHYFGSKDKLWKAVIDAYVTQGFHDVLTYLPDTQPEQCPLSTLQGHVAALLRLARTQPAVIRLVFNGLAETSTRAEHLRRHYLQPYLQRLDDQLSACRQRGLIRPVSSGAIHTLILGLVNILIQPSLLQYQPAAIQINDDRLIAELLTLFQHGIVPVPEDTQTLQE